MAGREVDEQLPQLARGDRLEVLNDRICVVAAFEGPPGLEQWPGGRHESRERTAERLSFNG